MFQTWLRVICARPSPHVNAILYMHPPHDGMPHNKLLQKQYAVTTLASRLSHGHQVMSMNAKKHADI